MTIWKVVGAMAAPRQYELEHAKDAALAFTRDVQAPPFSVLSVFPGPSRWKVAENGSDVAPVGREDVTRHGGWRGRP